MIDKKKKKHHYPILDKKIQITRMPNVVGFDVETYGKNNKFLMGSMYDGINFKIFWNKEDMQKEFFKREYHEHYTYFIATNLHFDFYAIFSLEYPHKVIERGSHILGIDIWHKKGEKYGDPRKGAKKIRFLDSTNYAFLSVEKLGKIINVPKGKTPSYIKESRIPRKDEYNEIEEYNKRDSEITQKFMIYLFSAFLEMGADIRVTIASTAMSLFRNKYLKGQYFRQKKEVLTDLFKGYYGGRTETFQRGRYKNINYYDINSLYPSVMRKNVFPDPNSYRYIENSHINTIMKYHGMSYVVVNMPYMEHPPLPKRGLKGKVIFPYGRFLGMYTHIELREAIKLGATIEEIRYSHIYTKTCKPFKAYVDDLYKSRLAYQKEGNAMQIVCKLLLNSLYGKFGQKFDDQYELVHYSTIKDFKPWEHVLLGDNAEIARVKKKQRPADFCIPIWAAYVTAYGRIKLHGYIVKCDALYADTDSIQTEQEIPTSDKIGEMKYEGLLSDVTLMRPKQYGYVMNKKDHIVIKGVSERMSYKELLNRITDGTGLLKTKFERFTKRREALKRGLVVNSIMDVTKNLELEDNKRVWKGKFSLKKQRSKPHKINETLEEDEGKFEQDTFVIREQEIINANLKYEANK